jgi:hypothetical protein
MANKTDRHLNQYARMWRSRWSGACSTTGSGLVAMGLFLLPFVSLSVLVFMPSLEKFSCPSF